MKPEFAIVFWDTNGWYFVSENESVCRNKKHTEIHDAILDAINSGYRIKKVCVTRGSVTVSG